ncbi:MAG: hypothetical protein KKB20_10400 [Proteobacteria bacterium]|nr:hypothetical protein [Pseudomonadota bacterium]
MFGSRLRLAIPALLGLVFLGFGLLMMVTAYHQDHPGVFLALFFSSSLIILLSLAVVFGLVWRIAAFEDRSGPEPPPDPED